MYVLYNKYTILVFLFYRWNAKRPHYCRNNHIYVAYLKQTPYGSHTKTLSSFPSKREIIECRIRYSNSGMRSLRWPVARHDVANLSSISQSQCLLYTYAIYYHEYSWNVVHWR